MRAGIGDGLHIDSAGAGGWSPMSECPRPKQNYKRSDLVLAAFARRSPTWAVVRADGEGDVPHPLTAAARLVWGEYERIDWERAHAGALTASSYCVRKGLIRKAQLAHNLKKWVAKRGGGGGRGGGSGPATATAPARACPSTLAAAVPETYVLQIDDEDYVDEALCDLPEVRDMVPGSMRWIVKAGRGSGWGKGGAQGGRGPAHGVPWAVCLFLRAPIHLLKKKKKKKKKKTAAVGDQPCGGRGGHRFVRRPAGRPGRRPRPAGVGGAAIC